jgi:excisionase family DNA binding protein
LPADSSATIPSNRRARRHPDTPPRRWASIQEAADYLHVHERTIRLMVAQERLTAYRNGPRLIRIDLNEVDAAMGEGI